MHIDPAQQLTEFHGAGLAGDFLPMPEKRQGRDAADAETGGNGGFGFGVEFHQAHSRFQARRRCFENRRHRPAGSAPRRPEIDQYGQVAAPQVALKGGGIDSERVRGEQRLFALAAYRRFAQA